MSTSVLVLGAGFAGLELATSVTSVCGDAVDVTVIDKNDGFVFGFSKLDVMFGRTTADHVTHSYDGIVGKSFRFVQATIESIDPHARTVRTSAGVFAADVLVIALGATVHPEATPGLVECGYEFYSNAGAFALKDVLQEFRGGRVVVGVTSTPFKCPPAPSETALLMHSFLTERGLRDNSTISLVMPFGRPIPPSPEASQALMDEFSAVGITWVPDNLVTALDCSSNDAVLSGGGRLGFDLFLGIPVHRAPKVVVDSGLTVDGWIPVDPHTLRTTWDGVYALGDVTSVGTPKAGVFSEGQARIAAEHIIGRVQGRQCDAAYDGAGRCYIEFGANRIAQVDIQFQAGKPPHGSISGPSAALLAEKHEFGHSRIQRWFGHAWE